MTGPTTCPSCDGEVKLTSLSLTCPHCDSKLLVTSEGIKDVTQIPARKLPRAEDERVIGSPITIEIPTMPTGMEACRGCRKPTAWVDLREGFVYGSPRLMTVGTREWTTPEGHHFSEPIKAMITPRTKGNYCRACLSQRGAGEIKQTAPPPPNPLARRPTDHIYSPAAERRVYPREPEGEIEIELDPIKAAIAEREREQQIALGLACLVAASEKRHKPGPRLVKRNWHGRMSR